MINSVSEINKRLKNDPIGFIGEVEKEYNDQLFNLANKIKDNKNIRIILLAGPSGSGKTTTSFMLKRILGELGVDVDIISLDNFYLEPNKMPKNVEGKPDFEAVESLDLRCMHDCFVELIEKGKTAIPKFNFGSVKRDINFEEVTLSKDGIAIVEGIHALNPKIVSALPKDSVFKLYISVGVSVVDDGGKAVLLSRQLRLIRRMSRDYIYRNSSAENTLILWAGVIEGEDKYLCPFVGTEDYRMNTFHSYEPAVFKNIIKQLKEQTTDTAENYHFLKEISDGLESFEEVDFEKIPSSSLLREFVPGGDFHELY